MKLKNGDFRPLFLLWTFLNPWIMFQKWVTAYSRKNFMRNPKKGSVFVHEYFEKWRSRILKKTTLISLYRLYTNNILLKFNKARLGWECACARSSTFGKSDGLGSGQDCWQRLEYNVARWLHAHKYTHWVE